MSVLLFPRDDVRMAIVDSLDNAKENGPGNESSAAVPSNGMIVLLAGMVAAWLAAGSVGLLACPLRHMLMWLPLVVAALAGWPRTAKAAQNWFVLAAGVFLGLLFTASSSPTVNVLAVAIVLAAVAQIGRGLTGRIALLAAVAAIMLGCFRLACDSIPAAWSAADATGSAMGWLAGLLFGRHVQLGTSFAGLDFLVLSTVVYAGWIVCTNPRAAAGCLRRWRLCWLVNSSICSC